MESSTAPKRVLAWASSDWRRAMRPFMLTRRTASLGGMSKSRTSGLGRTSTLHALRASDRGQNIRGQPRGDGGERRARDGDFDLSGLDHCAARVLEGVGGGAVH